MTFEIGTASSRTATYRQTKCVQKMRQYHTRSCSTDTAINIIKRPKNLILIILFDVMETYCGQMTGWIKMALGMEVGLRPGHIVLDGDPAAPRKRRHPPYPIFGPCLLWSKGWMDEDATWYGSRARTRAQYIRRVPSAPRKGHSTPPF